jgi:hypothetical protein
VPKGTFAWVFSEFWISDMETAIISVTRRLVEVSLLSGDLETLLWALRPGLEGARCDFGLWDLYLTMARRSGTVALARARQEAEAALGSDAAGLINL